MRDMGILEPEIQKGNQDPPKTQSHSSPGQGRVLSQNVWCWSEEWLQEGLAGKGAEI